jgi:hypothetical protein
MDNKIIMKGEMTGSRGKFRGDKNQKDEKDLLTRIVKKIRKIKKSSK